MNKLTKSCFYLLMAATFLTMIYGHFLIVSSGAWFIPGKEKYNILTRWVSDFASFPGKGLWIKGSIVLFCGAISLLMHARVRALKGDSAKEHLLWVWNSLLWLGLVGGLLLVVLFDMSPPQFVEKEPSFLGKIFGSESWTQQVPRSDLDYKIQWHHQLGFQIFIWSFLALLVTSAIEKLRPRISVTVRADLLALLLTLFFIFWLYLFHNTLAGVPQRALLILIFLWVSKEGSKLVSSKNTSAILTP